MMSESIKVYPITFARTMPIVLFPAPGIPIRIRLSLLYGLVVINISSPLLMIIIHELCMLVTV